MPDEPTNETPEPVEGKVLPQREMMSLLSTDPVSPDPAMYVTPGGPVDTPPTGEGPPLATLPVEPITEGETDSATDEASAS